MSFLKCVISIGFTPRLGASKQVFGAGCDNLTLKIFMTSIKGSMLFSCQGPICGNRLIGRARKNFVFVDFFT